MTDEDYPPVDLEYLQNELQDTLDRGEDMSMNFNDWKEYLSNLLERTWMASNINSEKNTRNTLMAVAISCILTGAAIGVGLSLILAIIASVN